MKTVNKIALAVCVLLLASGTAWMLREQPVLVETAEVKRGVFEQTVSDDGMTRVRNRYVISSPLAGRVERIALKAGDAVRAGQVVALLTPAAPSLLDARAAQELQERLGAVEAQAQRARAEVAKVSAQRDQAQSELNRQTKLAKDGFVSAVAREQAELAMQVADRSLDASRYAEHAAQHDLAQARAAVERFRSGAAGPRWEVSAPVAGVILKVMQESEGVVGVGTPLLEVSDMASMEAVVEVLSQESVAIRPGMPARIAVGTGIAPLAARVRRIEPAAFVKVSALGIEERRVNVVLDFLEPAERIRNVGDGFRIEADIVVERIDNAVQVPVGALFRDGDNWAVFAVEGDRAAKRIVKVPRRNSRSALVESGVDVGSRVVIYPSDSLRDGVRVAPLQTGR